MIDIENNYNDLKHLYEKAKKELPQGTESQIARVEEEKRELLSLFETKRSEGKALLNDYKSRCFWKLNYHTFNLNDILIWIRICYCHQRVLIVIQMIKQQLWR